MEMGIPRSSRGGITMEIEVPTSELLSALRKALAPIRNSGRAWRPSQGLTVVPYSAIRAVPERTHRGLEEL